MKQQILGLALACGMAASPALYPSHSQPAPEARVKQQILDLGKAWVDAEAKHDEAALRGILDDKFVATFDAQKPFDKDTFIKGELAGGVDPTQSQTLSDEMVILDGDTAVVLGVDTMHGTAHGKPYTETARYTVTYIRRHGRWVALAEHLVSVPPPH